MNSGIDFKTAMRFRGNDADKAPLYYASPIYFRISWFVDKNDCWRSIEDEESARSVLREILEVLLAKGVPFLDRLRTDSGILQLYDSGEVLGFEISRDEMRLLLLVHSGNFKEVDQRLIEYAGRWLHSGAARRASALIERLKARRLNRAGD